MSAQSFKVLGGKLKSMSNKEVALNYFHLLTRVKCTIHESMAGKVPALGKTLFSCSEFYSCHHDWQCRVCYQKIQYYKNIKNSTNDTVLLLLLHGVVNHLHR